MPDVDDAQFRQLLGRFATGVAVLTVTAPDGGPAFVHGIASRTLAGIPGAVERVDV